MSQSIEVLLVFAAVASVSRNLAAEANWRNQVGVAKEAGRLHTSARHARKGGVALSDDDVAQLDQRSHR